MRTQLDQSKRKLTSFLEKMLSGWVFPSQEDPSTDPQPPISEDTPNLVISAAGTLDRSTSYEEGEIFLELTLFSGQYQRMPVELEPLSLLGSFAQFTEDELSSIKLLFESWVQQLTPLKILEAGGLVLLQNSTEPEQWVCFQHAR